MGHVNEWITINKSERGCFLGAALRASALNFGPPFTEDQMMMWRMPKIDNKIHNFRLKPKKHAQFWQFSIVTSGYLYDDPPWNQDQRQ